jgi:ketosteroid isomerase-like protein
VNWRWEATERDTARAMSQENRELALRYTAAINAREVPDELLAPDFRIEAVDTAVTRGTYHGANGLRRWISDFFDVFGDGGRYVTRPIASGDDYVVGEMEIVGTGAVSGAPLNLRHYGVMRFRDGKITRAIGYATRKEAFEAVRLRD